MDPKLCFAIFLSLFLSWSLRGFSESGQSLEGIIKEVSKGAILEGVIAGDKNGSMQCVKKLLPCEPHFKSPSPPAECCNPLLDIVEADTELECLCKFINDPEIMKKFNLTRKEAVAIPYACGADLDITPTCRKFEKTPGGGNNNTASADADADADAEEENSADQETPAVGGSTNQMNAPVVGGAGNKTAAAGGADQKTSPSAGSAPSGSPAASSDSSNPTTPASDGSSSNPTSPNPPSDNKSRAAVTVTPNYYKFVTVGVLMVAAFNL